MNRSLLKIVAVVFVSFFAACTGSNAGEISITPVEATSVSLRLRAAPSAFPILPLAPPFAMAIASSTTDGGPGCIVIDEKKATGSNIELEGQVESGTAGHPNGTRFTFYLLQLSTPRCVQGLAGTTTVTEVQLAPMSHDRDVWDLVHAHVRVKGTPFPASTAWHVRPVLLGVQSVERL